MSKLLSRAIGWAKHSDPNAEASPLRVLSLAVALLGILGAAFSLTRTRGGVLDPVEFLGSLYQGSVPQPSGFGGPSGTQLPTGEKVATFLAGQPAEGEPSELVLMEFPVSRAESVLKDQFQALRFASGKSKWGGGGRGGSGGRGGGGHGGGSGGSDDGDKKPTLQDAGTFLWHGFDATYARVRYGKGGPDDEKPFYDVIRVNLSVNGHCVIGYLRFPERQPGALDQAEPIFAQFRPLGAG